MLNNPIILGAKLPNLSNPASASDVLSGKQLIDVNGNVLTGTMVNQGAINRTLSAGSSCTIPAGYHNGNGKITAAAGYEVPSNPNLSTNAVQSGKTVTQSALTFSFSTHGESLSDFVSIDMYFTHTDYDTIKSLASAVPVGRFGVIGVIISMLNGKLLSMVLTTVDRNGITGARTWDTTGTAYGSVTASGVKNITAKFSAGSNVIILGSESNWECSYSCIK